MAAIFGPRNHIVLLKEGGIIKRGLWPNPITGSQWYLHYGDRNTMSIYLSWIKGSVKDGYLVFSKDLGGYIATDKLRRAG